MATARRGTKLRMMATTTTMAMGDDNHNGNGAMRYDNNVDGDDKEVDGNSMRRSFRGGYNKGVVIKGAARAENKAGSSSSSPSSKLWASMTATRGFFWGGR